MVNYNNGKIYKLICDNSDFIYIGSTTQKLYKRLDQHKRYGCSSKKLFELGNVKIILIEDFKCENKEQLIKREQYYIDKYKNNIINNKNAVENKKENKLKYNNKNRDKIKEYYNKNRDRYKIYRIKNRDKINENKKKLYQYQKFMDGFTKLDPYLFLI